MHEALKLKLAGVSSGYGAVQIVKDVSFAVRPAEIFALMGKNGMGKTTLLKTILGFINVTRGNVEVDGATIKGKRPADLIASGIGYGPQELPLFQDLSIRDNLRLALRRDRELAAGIERVYGYFPFLKDRLGQKAGTLSGGEQKMLILARALMLRPKLLLLDEISEGLAPVIVQGLARMITTLKAKGYTIVMVEQNFRFAAPLADRFYVVEHGQIVETIASNQLNANMPLLAELLGV